MTAQTSPVSLFKFNAQDIRVVTLDGAPWFVTADVLRVLQSYIRPDGRPNTGTAVRILDDCHRMNLSYEEAKRIGLKDSASRAYGMSLISESGLYTFVMRSDKPQGKPFQDWVTREVLPSIRKTGSYVTGQPSLQENPQMDPLDLMMAQAELLPKLIAAMKEQRAVQAAQAQALAAQAQELKAVKHEMAEMLDYVSVFDFARTHKLKLTTGVRSLLGKQAANVCRDNDWNIKTKDRSGQSIYPSRAIKSAAVAMGLLKVAR